MRATALEHGVPKAKGYRANKDTPPRPMIETASHQKSEINKLSDEHGMCVGRKTRYMWAVFNQYARFLSESKDSQDCPIISVHRRILSGKSSC